MEIRFSNVSYITIYDARDDESIDQSAMTAVRGTQVCDMDRLYEICDKHGITVIEDCAHALGVTWRGEQLGNRAKVREKISVDLNRLPI